jgi:hypothetical protein|eukprot:31508-Pelagococcus_subviridis.AAC.10
MSSSIVRAMDAAGDVNALLVPAPGVVVASARRRATALTLRRSACPPGVCAMLAKAADIPSSDAEIAAFFFALAPAHVAGVFAGAARDDARDAGVAASASGVVPRDDRRDRADFAADDAGDFDLAADLIALRGGFFPPRPTATADGDALHAGE